jgi:spermidine synthase
MAQERKRSPAPAPGAPARARLFGAFFLSGAAGVMHEVVWSRRLVQLVGAEAYAQAVVLAVFMGGLAVGAVVLGRRADRGRPLRLYVLCEALIAAYGLILPALLAATGAGYLALVRPVFEHDGLRLALRFVLAAVTIAPPAVLMGGTLPALARHLAGAGGRGSVGGLYACNSVGAVLGTAVAGFLVLPALGSVGALLVASAASLAAGALLLPAARRESAAEAVAGPDPGAAHAAPEPPPDRWGARVVLAALAVSGFVGMGYEVLFVRVVGLSFASTAHSFTVMLIVFLSGIALGSALVARLRVGRSRWVMGLAQLGVAAAFVAASPLMARLPYFVGRLRLAVEGTGAPFAFFQVGKAALCVLVLLVPTTCLGAAFPLVAEARASAP